MLFRVAIPFPPTSSALSHQIHPYFSHIRMSRNVVGANNTVMKTNSIAPLTTITRAISSCYNTTTRATGTILAAALIFSVAAVEPQQQSQLDTLSNIPQILSGECASPTDCKKARIQRPKSRKAEACTTKCVTTCIRGGAGSPGEGPLNARGPIVVFKQGFRSRRYWCKFFPLS
uniref:Uncharacterized protein n=1 Tax=Nelumbo nucifera TaxID=4432 RepID=A0A822ZWQ9_NELNU|nr:TPA_asm: hypothetical protein HUJ06_004588 [Nelumbo nucifera]